MNKQYWLIVGTVALFGAICFQLFFRYQYISVGHAISKVDRVTGQACYLPCPVSTKSPGKTQVDADIISVMAYRESEYKLPDSQYRWVIYDYRDSDGKLITDDSKITPTTIRIVAYCKPNPQMRRLIAPGATPSFLDKVMEKFHTCGTGWYWQVRPTSSGYESLTITGNTVLEDEYGFTHAKE